jgi:hypothetical protein
MFSSSSIFTRCPGLASLKSVLSLTDGGGVLAGQQLPPYSYGKRSKIVAGNGGILLFAFEFASSLSTRPSVETRK